MSDKQNDIQMQDQILIDDVQDEPQRNSQPSEPEAQPSTLDDVTLKIQQQIAQETDDLRQILAESLDMFLINSRLPRPAIDAIKLQFSGRIYTMDELKAAIEEKRQILTEIEKGQPTQASDRIDFMFNEADRLQAAVNNLFGLDPDPALASLHAPKLSGIRELYLALTGDTEMRGGYFPDRVQLATTADFSGLVKNSLNKLVVNTWKELGEAGYDWWKNITVQEHFDTLHDITGTLVGTVGDLPEVSEGAAYTALPVGDSPEVGAFTKYGGYIPLTLELIDRDETRKLRAFARELASAGLRKISKLVAEIFTVNAGVGPVMGDSGSLFNPNPVTTLGGHNNLSTIALSVNSWDAVGAKIYQQPMLIKNTAGFYGTGPSMAVNPKYLLIPRALLKTGMEICSGSYVREAGYVYDNVLKGSAVPVVVPEWTDQSDWAAACDPRIAPAIFIGDRFGLIPEIYIAGSATSPGYSPMMNTGSR